MRVALYHPWIHTKGGGERVLLELLQKSQHDITIFTSHYNKRSTFKEFEKYDIRAIGNFPVVGEVFRGLIFGILTFLTKIPLENFDVFVVSSGGVAEIVLLRNHRIPTLGICLTPLRIVHDREIYAYKMRTKNIVSRMLTQAAICVYKRIEKRAWKHFDRVICISQTVKKRVVDGKLISTNKIDVVYPGVNSTTEAAPRKSQKYFFYPSRFSYHKRQELAVQSFIRFKEKMKGDFQLVVAGGVSPNKEKYFEKIRSLAAHRNDIIIKKNVSNTEWKCLYKNCYAVLFCGMNEDWGIAPLEASAYQKPVISVNEGGPRESIIHNKTGLLVDATPEKFADALYRLVKNPLLAKRMGMAGFKRSKKYDWKVFVENVDTIIQRVIHKNDRLHHR